jgi:hypothetical protein
MRTTGLAIGYIVLSLSASGCVIEMADSSDTGESLGEISQPAFMDTDPASFWPKMTGKVQVPYRFDEDVPASTRNNLLDAMDYLETTSRGWINFNEITGTPPSKWLRLTNSDGVIGSADGLGAANPRTLQFRNTRVIGIAYRPGQPSNKRIVTWYADGRVQRGAWDDPNPGDWVTDKAIYPTNPATGKAYGPDDVWGMATAAGDVTITWYKNGYRSKGLYPSLGGYAATAAFSRPAGLDPSATMVGVTVSSAQHVWSYWKDADGKLKTAIGSSTDLDAHIPLKVVNNPTGRSISDIAEIEADENDKLFTWFNDDSTHLARYEGTFSTLQSAGVGFEVGAARKGSAGLSTAKHELAHALGFAHEQKRGNRDVYVTVGSAITDHDYAITPSGTTLSQRSSYDFASITHYNPSSDDPDVPGDDSFLRPDGTTFTTSDQWSFLDMRSFFELNNLLPTWTTSFARLADEESANGFLAFSPRGGMCDMDIEGADFDSGGTLYTWYKYEGYGARRYSRGDEYNLSTLSATYTYPTSIGGATATPVALAISKSTDAVFAWYSAGTSGCSSGIWRTTGTAGDLDSDTGPMCVTMPSGYGKGIKIVDVAIDDYTGSGKIYVLYANGDLSVGSSVNFGAHRAPAPYNLPGSLKAADVYAFGLTGGTALFLAKGYRVWRDPNFATTFP